VERAVFINYRGADSHSYSALLYTELARQFGVELVFLDVKSILAGADIVQECRAAYGRPACCWRSSGFAG
jgi:hypothetical protein